MTDRKYTTSLIREPGTGNVCAKIQNGSYANVAYTNFEQTATTSFTNWKYDPYYITTTYFQNGSRGYKLMGSTNLITPLLPLSTSQKYKVSLWRKVGTTLIMNAGSTALTPRIGPQRNGWEYVEATFTGVNAINISGTGTIDELRLYPVNARMISYTYKDGVGLTSECNENNQTIFYEYDEFNRLKLIRDQSNYILKKNEYQFQYIQN